MFIIHQDLPPVNHLERIEEPYIIAQVITLIGICWFNNESLY